jgi:nicotinate-nucleotide adenylyltransferase
MKKPIVIFGGSFNPPTNAHFGLAEQIVNDYDVEKFLFLPVGDHYPKEELLPASVRLDMLQRACSGHAMFQVSSVEADHHRQLPTIETLELLQEIYQGHPICFVLGTDNLRDLPNWDRFEDILKQFYVLVLERGEDKASTIVEESNDLKSLDTNIIIMKEEVRTTCSSTIVRNRLKEGKGVHYLVPREVSEFILENELYQKR